MEGLVEFFAAIGILLLPWALMVITVPAVAIKSGQWITQHGTALRHAMDNYKVARDVQRRSVNAHGGEHC